MVVPEVVVTHWEEARVSRRCRRPLVLEEEGFVPPLRDRDRVRQGPLVRVLQE